MAAGTQNKNTSYKMVLPEDFLEMDVQTPERKSKKDIRTPMMAVKSCKATVDHKLKPRSKKRDRTKTEEAKMKAKIRRNSLLDSEILVDVDDQER